MHILHPTDRLNLRLVQAKQASYVRFTTWLICLCVLIDFFRALAQTFLVVTRRVTEVEALTRAVMTAM